nr:Hypothetical protein CBG01471 [Haemonchus contortus]
MHVALTRTPLPFPGQRQIVPPSQASDKTLPKNKSYHAAFWLCSLFQPKDEETNKLQFLREFPWYANESCDQVRNLLPVVDCPDSVCIKAVITEPPAKRDVCVQGGAVVRDCWSRVIGEDGPFALDPRALRDVVRSNLLF